MKTFKIKLTILFLGFALFTVAPVSAQINKDTTATTKANGAGAGTGVSQGAPGSATVSGTGTGTLQDSTKTSVPAGDAGVKQSTATDNQQAVNPSQGKGYWILGVFGLIGLLALIFLRRTRNANR